MLASYYAIHLVIKQLTEQLTESYNGIMVDKLAIISQLLYQVTSPLFLQNIFQAKNVFIPKISEM